MPKKISRPRLIGSCPGVNACLYMADRAAAVQDKKVISDAVTQLGNSAGELSKEVHRFSVIMYGDPEKPPFDKEGAGLIAQIVILNERQELLLKVLYAVAGIVVTAVIGAIALHFTK